MEPEPTQATLTLVRGAINQIDIGDVVTALAPEGTTSVTVTPVTDPAEIDKVLGNG